MLKAFRTCNVLKNLLFPTLLPKPYCRKYRIPTFKPFYESFLENRDSIAVIDKSGFYNYGDILYTSFVIAKRIETIFPNCRQDPQRISFLCPNESIYVAVLLACWITGNVAVPLSTYHPKKLLEFTISNSDSRLVIATESEAKFVADIAKKLDDDFFVVSSVIKDAAIDINEYRDSKFFNWDLDFRHRIALMIYTSGTTGVPKGVPLTHNNLFAQISSLVTAWEITSKDVILHSLPLHHMHGIMNALLCLLHVGGTVLMLPKFNAVDIWNYLIHQTPAERKVNLFFGVPTMYVKLIEEYFDFPNKSYIKEQCQENIRLFTSGSAPLPESVLRRWREITGHILLERYGMSEVGMALSNPLNGPRMAGTVGLPLPGVDVKIVDESSYYDKVITYAEGNDLGVRVYADGEGKEGELLIRGENVFNGYWKNETETNKVFTDYGWFRTGDMASCESGYFKILGRISTDIIKHKGFKISAFAVESCIYRHPKVVDCAVIGLEDEECGEKVACVLVTEYNERINEELIEICKEHLPAYSVPSLFEYVIHIPRNQMGKMDKKYIRKIYFNTDKPYIEIVFELNPPKEKE